MSEEYKTLDEFLLSWRGDGRKFAKNNWVSNPHFFFEPIFKSLDGYWYGLREDGTKYSEYLLSWREWHPPKTKKKVTLYRAIFKTSNGEYVTDSSWSDRKSYTCSRVSIESGPPILYEEREIEVGE